MCAKKKNQYKIKLKIYINCVIFILNRFYDKTIKWNKKIEIKGWKGY
jgi:hypothetical protein